MKKEDLFELLGEIDEEILNETVKSRGVENKEISNKTKNTKNEYASDKVQESAVETLIEVYHHKLNWKAIAAAAACLVIGTVSVTLVLGKNNSTSIPTDNPEKADIINTEISESDASPADNTSGYELKEYRTYPGETTPNSISYAGGNLFLRGISEEKNYTLLKYYDIENEKTVFAKFLSSTDIPDKYKPSDSLSSTLRIKDLYVSEDGYMYYCGEVSEWKNREKTDGAAGRFNLKTGENEIIKFFEGTSFSRISMKKNSAVMCLTDTNGNNYVLDSNFEITENESSEIYPDEDELYDHYTNNMSVSEYHKSSELTPYNVLSIEDNWTKEIKIDLSSGEEEHYYSNSTFYNEDGILFRLHTYEQDGYAYTDLIRYEELNPSVIIEDGMNGVVSPVSTGKNLLLSYFDSGTGKTRYMVCSPEGEKLSDDFEMPETHMNFLGNKSSETGEKIYYLARDTNKIMCYEPETNSLNDLSSLNDRFDFLKDSSYPWDDTATIQKGGKYDFQIFDDDSMYGYNVDTDELVLIADNLSGHGVNFTGFAVADDGNIYCITEDSNTIYMLVPKTENPGNNNK